MPDMSVTATTTSGLTWEQFLALPDTDEYRHAELVDGEVVVNPPNRLHQRIVLRLGAALHEWTQGAPGPGEVTADPGVQIGDRTGYLPDVAWYPEDRCPPGSANFVGAPALAVEVLSPSTRAFDSVRKRNDYGRIGVEELWLVDPEGPAAQVYRRPAPEAGEFALVREVKEDGVLSSPLLPGFAFTVGDLVRR